MKLTTQIFSIAALVILMTACKNTDFKKTKEGFPYKVFSDGKGEKIMPGYILSYHMTQKLKDSVLETTYGGNPQYLGIPKGSKDSITHPLAKLLVDAEARKGDSIKILQPIDSLVSKSPQMGMNPLFAKAKGQDLVTIVKVVEVFKNEEEAQAVFEKENIASYYQQPGMAEQRKKDEQAIEAYLKANNMQAQKTSWGAYVQVINPGSGPKAKLGQFVSVRYTGKDLTGKVFDTNNKPGAAPLDVQLGAAGAIIGFQDGLRQLAKGSKAVIYIPSVIAYGPQGNPPVIQPNQNLMFEIDVLDVGDKRPMPPTSQTDTTRR